MTHADVMTLERDIKNAVNDLREKDAVLTQAQFMRDRSQRDLDSLLATMRKELLEKAATP